MKKYKIGVYQICKNEKHNIEKWYQSIKDEQDGIFVTDTGSTDGSIDILKSLQGVSVFEQTIKPWRFDTQRNIQLNNVSEDFDVLVQLDFDEILSQNWKLQIRKNWNPNYNNLMYNYVQPQQNNFPEVKDMHENIHRRDDCCWKYPIHEIIEYTDKTRSFKFVDTITCYHYPDLTKKLKNNNYLSNIMYWLNTDEFNDDYYLSFQLGKEYQILNDFPNAKKQYYNYLQITYKELFNQFKENNNIKFLRLEQYNNIQNITIKERNSEKININDFYYQIQLLLNSVSENPFAIQNWIQLQEIWNLINNYSMVYSCCNIQLQLSKNLNQKLVPIEYINNLITNQKSNLRKEIV